MSRSDPGGARARPKAPRTTASATGPGPAAAIAARYPVVALVLQGGGALGSYQAGVFEGLDEAGIEPGWVAGISIGALNAAIIAGNPRERRVEQLRAFWETICRPPLLPASPLNGVPAMFEAWLHTWEQGMAAVNAGEAWRAMTEGQNGFFRPRMPPAWSRYKPGPGEASWYDIKPLRDTLTRFVDFDRINAPGAMRVSVGAVDVATGNFVYFDNTRDTLAPEHFMASGALPPGFPAVQVGDRWYWDGGLVSNTPLTVVLGEQPRRDALVFQVDLWSARGVLPRDLFEVANRQKDVQYSSRTRLVTDMLALEQSRAELLRELLDLVPPARRDHPAFRRAERAASDRRVNVVHLIYDDKDNEGHFKDYQFSALTMRDHWRSGLADLRGTLAHPDWLDRPASRDRPFVTHDVHRGKTKEGGPEKKKPAPDGAG
jgi:NTE family protein